MAKKTKPLNGRVSLINRFNKDPKYSDFPSKFQNIMIQRLNLNYIDKYHKKNIDKIVRSVTNNPSNTINTKIANGFLLTCNVEPELYINIQETAKKITGDFLPIDELIYLLLSYFCFTYNKDLPEKELPYKHVLKGKSRSKLFRFQKRFEKFYGNIVRDFTE